jgi:rfaE bifunctional protein kinase chain/domain
MKRRKILELLESFKGIAVTVVGDYILDQYMVGDTGRVSREAPVVVIDYKGSIYHPGGAANAARNVASLGGSPVSVGVVGADREGDILRELLEEKGVGISRLVPNPGIETALKIRITAGDLHAQRQQVARVDRLYEIEGHDPVFDALAESLSAAIEESGVVLISDYGMGVVPGTLSDMAIAACRRKGIPLVVDSRFDLMKYRGATIAVPNEVEAMNALALDPRKAHEMETIAAAIVERAGLDGIIITRGHQGMFVRSPGGETRAIGIVGSGEATDVTGAGDTVAAATALTLAVGGSFVEAAEVASCAAAVVVMKRGTAAVAPREIEELLEAHSVS